MRDGFLRGSRYSPGNMDRQSLETLFVGRNDVMEDVLSRVMESVGGTNKHYILLVGPRGSGKTHLLALAYHLLMDRIKAAKMDDKVAVALLNEEEWGVASFLDLIVRVLSALAYQAPELSADIDNIYARFSKDPASAETFAIERLRQHTRGKTLLLLCENLVDLFDGLGDEGQKRWRTIIQEDGNWAIVASTPSLFSAVALQDNPFYGFFTIRALNKIGFETGIDLLVKKAVHEGKIELANFLSQPLGRARVRAIHHLAAGNYRAYVVLFDFLDKESLRDLVHPFMEMVDDLTPYYQDRMRQIPPAQRKIVEFLCRQSTPANVKDVAISCLMSHQTTAKQIGELSKAGFITRNRIGRNTFCELSEPLMRICIEVKDSKTQHFKLFVEFLRCWFTKSELKKRHADIDRDRHDAQLDLLHVAEAVRRSLADEHDPVIEALSEEGMRARDAGDYHGLATIQEKLVRDGGGEATDYHIWGLALLKIDEVVAAIEVGREGASKYPEHADIQCCLALALYGASQFVEALTTIDKAITVDPERATYPSIRAGILIRLERFEEAIQAAQAALDVDPEHWHSFRQMVDASVALKRYDDAEAYAYELVERASDDPDALLVAARVHLMQDQFASALQIVDAILDADPDNYRALKVRGSVLFEMEDYDRAVVDRQRFVGLQPKSVSARRQLAGALLLAGRYDEALDVAERLIVMDPTEGRGHLLRGIAMAILGRQGDAVTAFDELLATEDCSLLLLAASNVREFGDYTSAHRYLDRVADLRPDDLELWMERVRLKLDEGDLVGAADSAAKIEAMPGRSMLGQLFVARVHAATEPLAGALEVLGDAIEPRQFGEDEELHFAAVVGILTRSLRSFGPQHLAQGLAKLQDLLGRFEEGVIGRVITDFLKKNVKDGFAGPLEEWERALDGIAANLTDLSDCQIPVKMLRAAVTYTKTGDVRRLMSLPLEQRQLLESILSSDAGMRAG